MRDPCYLSRQLRPYIVFTILLRHSAALLEAAASCLDDAILEENRIEIDFGDVSLPFGIFELDWTSAKLIARAAKIVAEEFLGYKSTISGLGSGSIDGLWALVDCESEETCPDESLATSVPHHAVFESWEQTSPDVPEVRRPQWVYAGYDGNEGNFVLKAQLEAAYSDRGAHLEYYGEYDAAWRSPWDFFDNYQDIPTTRIMPCSETQLTVETYLERVRQFTPNNDAFNEDGSAYCPDGYWWLSPACRQNTSRCIPMITGGNGWFTPEAMQRAIGFNLPIAWGTAATWTDYTDLPYHYTVLPYSWEPSMHYITLGPKIIQFPPTDAEAVAAGDSRTMQESTKLWNMFTPSLEHAAPRLWTTLLSMSISFAAAQSMLENYYASGDLDVSACWWLRNNTAKIIQWVPIATQCGSGAGLVNGAGAFVTSREEGVDCGACRSGNFAEALPADEYGVTNVCSNCSAGKVQPLWGSSICESCAAGYYMDSVGRSACDRCSKGTFAEGLGNSECQKCPSGWTTDGTGFRSASDCQCPTGTYQFNNSGDMLCIACTDESDCPGFGAIPEALPGYYLAEVTAQGLSIFECFQDSERCPGGPLRTCSEGREGNACARCQDGTSPAEHGTCKSCGEADYLPVILTATFCLACIVAIYWHASTESKTQAHHLALLAAIILGQTLSVLQLAGIFARIPVGWPHPMDKLVTLLRQLTLEMDELVRIGCWARLSPTIRFGGKIFFILAVATVVVIIHTLSVAILHHCQFHRRSFALTSSIGILVMTLHISITGLILSPFNCQQHPNSIWTMTQYEDVICWDSSEHSWMLGMGAVSLLVPLSFLAAVIRLLWVIPGRIRQGDTAFLSTYSFLFGRVKPNARWFVLAALSRGISICVIASIPDGFGQVFLMNAIFMASLLTTLVVFPWRLNIANYLDVFCHLAILTVLLISTACISDIDINLTLLSKVNLVCFIVLLTAAPFVFLAQLLTRLWRGKQRPFRYFLSHQKSAAGGFARLLKMTLETRQQLMSGKVFLDSDNLSDLTKLFHYVRHDTHTVLVISTKDIFRRVWCIGEITVAYLSQIQMIPIFFPDFSGPSEGFIEKLTLEVPLDSLVENGINGEQVRATLRHFNELPGLTIPCQLDFKSMSKLCLQISHGKKHSIAQVAQVSQNSSENPRKRTSQISQFSSETDQQQQQQQQQQPSTPVSKRGSTPYKSVGSAVEFASPQSCILVDVESTEAVSSGLILLLLLTPMMASTPEKIPKLLGDAEMRDSLPIAPDPDAAFILILSPDCFSSPDYLVGLCQMIGWQARHVLPVVTFDDFVYPSGDFYPKLEASMKRLCLNAGTDDLAPALLHNFVHAIFKKICSRVMVLGSSEMLEVQASVVHRHLLDKPGLALELHENPPKILEICKLISSKSWALSSQPSCDDEEDRGGGNNGGADNVGGGADGDVVGADVGRGSGVVGGDVAEEVKYSSRVSLDESFSDLSPRSL